MCEVHFSLAFVNLANLDVGESGVIEQPLCYKTSASPLPKAT